MVMMMMMMMMLVTVMIRRCLCSTAKHFANATGITAHCSGLFNVCHASLIPSNCMSVILTPPPLLQAENDPDVSFAEVGRRGVNVLRAIQDRLLAYATNTAIRFTSVIHFPVCLSGLRGRFAFFIGRLSADTAELKGEIYCEKRRTERIL